MRLTHLHHLDYVNVVLRALITGCNNPLYLEYPDSETPLNQLSPCTPSSVAALHLHRSQP